MRKGTKAPAWEHLSRKRSAQELESSSSSSSSSKPMKPIADRSFSVPVGRARHSVRAVLLQVSGAHGVTRPTVPRKKRLFRYGRRIRGRRRLPCIHHGGGFS